MEGLQRSEPRSLGELLREMVEENQSAFRFYEINAIKAWQRVMGPAIASKTMRPFIRNGVMTVRVPSAPLRHELNMMRSRIALAINKEIERDVVKELKFIG